MPRKKPSAIDALARHNDERRALDDRGAELRRAAALELGFAVLEAGGEALSLADVRQAIASAVRKHSDPQVLAKGGNKDPNPPAATKRGVTPAEDAEHG